MFTLRQDHQRRRCNALGAEPWQLVEENNWRTLTGAIDAVSLAFNMALRRKVSLIETGERIASDVLQLVSSSALDRIAKQKCTQDQIIMREIIPNAYSFCEKAENARRQVS